MKIIYFEFACQPQLIFLYNITQESGWLFDIQKIKKYPYKNLMKMIDEIIIFHNFISRVE